MAQFTRLEVVQQMESDGMVPLFFHPDINTAKAVLKACYDGGSRLMEFTSRGDFAIEVFKELALYVAKELPGIILGVGSITDAAAASKYMLYGANFVVTPVFREDIAVVYNRRKLLWSEGCGSLTEIAQAEEMGCEIVKLFPGSVYGSEFVKAVKGPQPWTSIMPTGGVSTDAANLKDWFQAGVLCVGMGSKLIRKELLANKDYDQLTQEVQKTLALIQKIKMS